MLSQFDLLELEAAMYAISSPSEIYHVLTSRKEITFCGLRVSQAETDTELAKAFLLQPVYPSIRSTPDRLLCYHCVRLERQKAVL
jgi:hypothetical protein